MARRVFAGLTFNRVDDDHGLKNTFQSMDWDGLLETGPAFGRHENDGPLFDRSWERTI